MIYCETIRDFQATGGAVVIFPVTATNEVARRRTVLHEALHRFGLNHSDLPNKPGDQGPLNGELNCDAAKGEERFFVRVVLRDRGTPTAGKWKVRVSLAHQHAEPLSAAISVTVSERADGEMEAFRKLSDMTYLYPLAPIPARDVPELDTAAGKIKGSAVGVILTNRLHLSKLSAAKSDAEVRTELKVISDYRRGLSEGCQELLDLGTAKTLRSLARIELAEGIADGIRPPEFRIGHHQGWHRGTETTEEGAMMGMPPTTLHVCLVADTNGQWDFDSLNPERP